MEGVGIDIAHLQGWIGREETCKDVASPAAMSGLAALLDHDPSPWRPGEVPPLGHWLYFQPRARQSDIGHDGHPRRGGFLPPVPLPRRMWAGGKIDFHAPIAIDAPLARRSIIRDVVHKKGGSGDLVFVTVEHEVRAAGMLALTERQDLVYREAAAIGVAKESAVEQSPGRPSLHERMVIADPVLLFRYSALTFNSHRIHYDRDYARHEEGYAGLVVHGPLIATLLVDHLLWQRSGATLSSFSFRGLQPLTDIAPFALCLAEADREISLWSRDASGAETMAARARLVS